MARTYKGIEYTSTPYEELEFYKSQTFTNNDTGINAVQYRSESLEFNDSGVGNISYTKSGSHYNFIRNMLFDSASFVGYRPHKLHLNKVYNSGSVIYIPQQYFGERIKPETFLLRDDSTSKQILIRDDGEGNLYSINAKFSQSVTPASSSDNYVGNIHYETGVVIITETGSWSGSKGGNDKVNDIDYTDVGRGNFQVDFESTKTIHTNELIVFIKRGEFNSTTNRSVFSASSAGYSTQVLAKISSSMDDFDTYASSIAFYQRKPGQNFSLTSGNYGEDTPGGSWDANGNWSPDNVNTTEPWWGGDNPETSGMPMNYEEKAVLIANFPRPIKMSSDTDLTIIIRYDT